LIQFMAIENVSGEPVGYFISVEENDQISRFDKELFIQFILLTILLIFLLVASFMYVRYQIKINEISYRDNLTGLYNRHKFNELAEAEMERCKRYGGDFSILMIDIDFFKRVNDSYGHLSGDKVLKSLGKLLIEVLRRTDVVARWGGEEFIICLPNANEEATRIVAEKIRRNVEEFVFEKVGHISISIGGTLVRADDLKLDGPIGRADEALYISKEQGRNRVTII